METLSFLVGSITWLCCAKCKHCKYSRERESPPAPRLLSQHSDLPQKGWRKGHNAYEGPCEGNSCHKSLATSFQSYLLHRGRSDVCRHPQGYVSRDTFGSSFASQIILSKLCVLRFYRLYLCIHVVIQSLLPRASRQFVCDEHLAEHLTTFSPSKLLAL